VDYAKSERIRDYEKHYYNSLTSEKLGSLGKKAEDAKIKWKGSLYLVSIEDVLKSYNGNVKTIVVLNGSLKKNSVSKSLLRLTPSKKSEARIPKGTLR
jgi:hypothetical protein